MSKVGDRIHVLRIKRGLSQAQLADAIGMKRSAIGNYERGIREPDLDTIEAFADFFDVSIADLMGREETGYLRDALLEVDHQLTAPFRSSEWRMLSEGLAKLELKNNVAFQATAKYLSTMYPEIFTERTDDDDPES